MREELSEIGYLTLESDNQDQMEDIIDLLCNHLSSGQTNASSILCDALLLITMGSGSPVGAFSTIRYLLRLDVQSEQWSCPRTALKALAEPETRHFSSEKMRNHHFLVRTLLSLPCLSSS